MILKASARGGGMQLGAHLLKAENEHVEVHEVRGFVSDDLRGAMKEAQAVAAGTRCKQHLFSVSLNPPANEKVGIAAFEQALERIEKQTGLAGQPRIVVFHEKEGRRHCHAVWSRIDADTMTARPLPFFKMKLREISKGLYLEHGWQLPRGLIDSRERDPRNFSLAEWQQAKRTGRDPKLTKALIQECWSASDSKAAFAKALEERGLYLARGDKRAHVAVTLEGDAVSVARAIGKRSKEVVARLGPAAETRTVADTKQHIAAIVTPRLQGLIAEVDRHKTDALRPLFERRQAMRLDHRDQRQALDDRQSSRRAEEKTARAARLRRGVVGLWDRLTGRHGKTVKLNEAEASMALRRDASQRDALVAGHLSERRGLQKDIVAVRDRHAASMLELHRDLANQRGSAENRREGLSDSFRTASRGDHGDARASSPVTVVRGRTRSAGRDGPDFGR